MFSLQRTASVARKEFLHIIRDPATLFFAFFIPVIELFMLGYAIDTNVRNIRTVILDQLNNQDSWRLLQKFENTDDFNIVERVYSEKDLNQAIVAGRAKVGIWIRGEYSRRLESGDTTQILVLVDGSESSTAAQGLNVSNALALRESLERVLQYRTLPVDVRPKILFNPTTRSPNFFIPGLMVVMCQMMAIMLSANAIVREKENGTLEQLFMTPVLASELILGKLIPYFGLTIIEFCTIIVLMVLVFRVPIHGHAFTLFLLTLPFIFSMLGLGLYISTRVGTREAAGHMAMGTMMPSIFLSGYVFPVESMPLFFQGLAQVFPTTWLIDAARGVILRGAGWAELWLHAVVLTGMGVALFTLAMTKFQKRLT
jgi:ABC-2 type transport system permease protein